MSEYCVYLKMPSYLRQWFIHRHGGNNPVSLIRGSIESKLLQRATVPQPSGILPPRLQEGEVAVYIPYSKSHDPLDDVPTVNHPAFVFQTIDGSIYIIGSKERPYPTVKTTRSTGHLDGEPSVRKYEVSFTAKKALALCDV